MVEIKMLAIEGFVRILVIVFLEVIFIDRSYANSRSCYDVDNKNICYFQPIAANTRMTWDDAWNICKENNSTLPVIENRLIAETIRRHIDSKTSIPDDTWLAGTEYRTDDWQWLNGKPFGRQSTLKEPAFRYDAYKTNAVIEGLQFKPFYPREGGYYICHFTDSAICQNKSTIPWENGCLFVNNDGALNLVDARNSCLDEGGDLATFEEDEDLHMLKQKNSSLLHTYRQYWIGLRLNWWIWNETATSKEIKYSKWSNYENLLKKQCLFTRRYHHKWNQDECTAKKPFLCQTVNTQSQTQRTDDVGSFSPTGSPEDPKALSNEILFAIIGSIVAVVIVAAIIVVLVVILKISRKRGVSHRSDKMPTDPREMSVHPIENKSVKSKAIYENEMTNHYAEIARAVDHENDDECRDEPQPGTVYAALEFDASKAIYEEPVISIERKQEARASAMVDVLNGNSQRGSSAESPTRAAEGTIYANM